MGSQNRERDEAFDTNRDHEYHVLEGLIGDIDDYDYPWQADEQEGMAVYQIIMSWMDHAN